MQTDREGIILLSNGKPLSPKAVSQIRNPIPEEDRKVISDVMFRFYRGMPEGSPYQIGGYDRSFDEHSGTYGNSFIDFEEWPKDKPMDAQAQAEFFIGMCFTDTLVRLHKNGIITDEELDSISWMSRKGMIVSAAATVNYIMNNRKEDDNV